MTFFEHVSKAGKSFFSFYIVYSKHSHVGCFFFFWSLFLIAAYKHADGRKIDGRRVLVDVERGRTVKGWLPRRLGMKIF